MVSSPLPVRTFRPARSALSTDGSASISSALPPTGSVVVPGSIV
jgi:hypothetical protein